MKGGKRRPWRTAIRKGDVTDTPVVVKCQPELSEKIDAGQKIPGWWKGMILSIRKGGEKVSFSFIFIEKSIFVLKVGSLRGATQGQVKEIKQNETVIRVKSGRAAKNTRY